MLVHVYVHVCAHILLSLNFLVCALLYCITVLTALKPAPFTLYSIMTSFDAFELQRNRRYYGKWSICSIFH